MTKLIKDNLRALGLGLAMLPALVNAAQGAPAHESNRHESDGHESDRHESTAHHSAAYQALTAQLAGKTVATATPQELAQAVKAAIQANPKLAKAIVRGVFSQLGANDRDKARAVIGAAQSVVPAGDFAGIVRAAVEALSTQSNGSGFSARSVLGRLVSQEAMNLDPANANAIRAAVRSIFSSEGGNSAGGINFQGPGGVSNPANSSNSSGSVNSPSS